MTRLQVRGIQLNVDDWGTGKPILLLHGFTGSTATWDFMRPISYRLIAVDLPGHGRSDSPDEPARYRMDQTVADLSAVLDLLGLERVHLLGYSMGGRVALHLALAAPARIESLILESTSPGIEDEAERRARVRSDESLAQLLDRDGLEPFIDHWERIPLFASQARLPAEARASLREQRLAGSAPGLANSLRGAGAGQQDSLWDRLDSLTMPALLLAGALDAKYCAIASCMAAIMPRAQMVIVPEAGHAVHLEAPGVVEREIVRFLGSVPLTPGPSPYGGEGSRMPSVAARTNTTFAKRYPLLP